MLTHASSLTLRGGGLLSRTACEPARRTMLLPRHIYGIADPRPTLSSPPLQDSGLLSRPADEPARRTTLVSLITATVKLDDEERTLRFAFRIVSPQARYTCRACDCPMRG